METKRLFLLLCLCSYSVFAQNRYYVNQTQGRDTYDGSSWSSAYATLQMAIDKVKSGDEIWVAAGTYHPTRAIDIDGNPTTQRHQTFAIPNGVKLYGGFPAQATNNTGLNNRDWEKNPTILSGDLNKDDKANFSNMEENVYRVVYLLNTDESTVIDGFTITGGNTDFEGMHRKPQGSGISAVSNISGSSAKSSPTLKNLIIEGNISTGGGAGFSNYASDGEANPVISNTIIRRNKSGDYGGGFANYGRIISAPILENVIISGNQALQGGGMYCTAEASVTSPVLTNVLVSGNRAESDAGGIFISSCAGNVRPVLTNVTISGNKAGSFVGGLLCYANPGISSPKILNTVIIGNKADVMIFYDFYNEGNTMSRSDMQHFWIPEYMEYPTMDAIYFFDPKFVKAIDADNAPTTEGDYRLAYDSPFINKGNNSFISTRVDLAGSTRIIDKTVDMGAYEYQGISPYSTVSIQSTVAEKQIWSEDGNLYIRIDQPSIVRIYSVNGALIRQISMTDGDHTISLPTGFYLVSLSNGTIEKVFVSK